MLGSGGGGGGDGIGETEIENRDWVVNETDGVGDNCTAPVISMEVVAEILEFPTVALVLCVVAWLVKVTAEGKFSTRTHTFYNIATPTKAVARHFGG